MQTRESSATDVVLKGRGGWCGGVRERWWVVWKLVPGGGGERWKVWKWVPIQRGLGCCGSGGCKGWWWWWWWWWDLPDRELLVVAVLAANKKTKMKKSERKQRKGK